LANYTRNDLSGILAPVNAELEKVEVAIAAQLDREPALGEANQMSGDLDLNSNRAMNGVTPQVGSDLATKSYVDSKAQSNAETPSITITKFRPSTVEGTVVINVEDKPDTLNLYVNGVLLLESAGDYSYSVITGDVLLTTPLILEDEVEIQYGAVASDATVIVPVYDLFQGTTEQLIQLSNTYNVGQVLTTSGYATVGDGGGAQWVKTATTGTVSQSPAQLADGLLNDAGGNQWALISKPVSVKMFGAIGIVESGGLSARLAVQAAINSFKNPDLTGLVGATNFRDRLVYGRVLDLGGDQYFIDTHLDYSLAHGILIQNGTLVATTDGTWNAGEALLQNQSDFCINPMFSDIVVECNGATNGIFLERGVYGVLDNVRVYGWFEQDYAVKAGSNTLGFTTNIHFNNLKLWGTIAAETVNAPTATATGLIITDSDCEVTGGEISRAGVGIKLSSAGSIRGTHLTGNSNNNAIGIELSGLTLQKVLDCYFDNSILEMNAREKIIIGNSFFNSGGVESSQAIILNSTKADDDLADCTIVGNRAKLANGQRFITLDETAGDFLTIGQAKVTDNTCRDAAALAAISTQETTGIITVNINSNDFNGLAVQVNLGSRLLFAGAPSGKFSGAVTASPNATTSTPYCKGMLYDPVTETLTILFSEVFTGTCGIAYQWGQQDNPINAFLPASPVTSNSASFSGYLNANQTNVTGNGTIYTVPFNAERYDNGSIFSTISGKGVIITGGVYSLDAQVMIDGLSGATDLLMRIVAGGRVFEDRRAGTFSSQRSLKCSGGVLLAAGDEIAVTIQVSGNGSDNVTVNGSGDYRTFISAVLQP
jgi:hypothetical protein